jgi:hypothetical protein
MSPPTERTIKRVDEYLENLEGDIYQYVVRDAINYVRSGWSKDDDPTLWCDDIKSIIKELNTFQNLLLEEIESNK